MAQRHLFLPREGIAFIPDLSGQTTLNVTGTNEESVTTTTNINTNLPEENSVLLITVDPVNNEFKQYLNGNLILNTSLPDYLTSTNASSGVFRILENVSQDTELVAVSAFNTVLADTDPVTLNNFYLGRPYVGYGEGYYYFYNSIDLTDVFTSYLSSGIVVGAIFKGGTSGNNDIFQITDIFQVIDIFGIEADGWEVRLDIRTTEDDPSDSGVVWTEWTAFTAGSHTFRAAEFRLWLKSNAVNVTPYVSELSVNVDMPDRVEAANALTVPTGGANITFSPPFKDIPAINITVQDGDAGDEITDYYESAEGFGFRVFNRVSMAYVERVYNFAANGYGRVLDG